MGISPRKFHTSQPLHGDPRRKFRTNPTIPQPLNYKSLNRILSPLASGEYTRYCNHHDNPCATPAVHKARKDAANGVPPAPQEPKLKRKVNPRNYCNCPQPCESQDQHVMRACHHEPECKSVEDHLRLKRQENAEDMRRLAEAREKIFRQGLDSDGSAS
jgi:hypothetical protein